MLSNLPWRNQHTNKSHGKGTYLLFLQNRHLSFSPPPPSSTPSPSSAPVHFSLAVVYSQNNTNLITYYNLLSLQMSWKSCNKLTSMYLSEYHTSQNKLMQLWAYPGIGWSAAFDQELHSGLTVDKVSWYLQCALTSWSMSRVCWEH